MDILDTIVAHKRKEVEELKQLYPPALLEKSLYFAAQPVSLRKYLKRPDRVGVIAEIKRRSPSRGELNPRISVEQLSIGYMQAGASALSILTDSRFFGGSSADLTTARKFNFCPILRKDFVVDEYQVLEAKSIGADAVLLIARILDCGAVRRFAALAHDLGLEVLLEVHSEAELLQSPCDAVDAVGVNNRNLDDFSVDPGLSLALAGRIPASAVKVAESGIADPETVCTLAEAGFEGFLIGEAFMSQSRPEEACRALIEGVRRIRARRTAGAER